MESVSRGRLVGGSRVDSEVGSEGGGSMSEASRKGVESEDIGGESPTMERWEGALILEGAMDVCATRRSPALVMGRGRGGGSGWIVAVAWDA
jgi:hypothetical protein